MSPVKKKGKYAIAPSPPLDPFPDSEDIPTPQPSPPSRTDSPVQSPLDNSPPVDGALSPSREQMRTPVITKPPRHPVGTPRISNHVPPAMRLMGTPMQVPGPSTPSFRASYDSNHHHVGSSPSQHKRARDLTPVLSVHQEGPYQDRRAQDLSPVQQSSSSRDRRAQLLSPMPRPSTSREIGHLMPVQLTYPAATPPPASTTRNVRLPWRSKFLAATTASGNYWFH